MYKSVKRKNLLKKTFYIILSLIGREGVRAPPSANLKNTIQKYVLGDSEFV